MMSLNIPVLALSLIGVLMVAAGLFMQGGNGFIALLGVVVVLLAWILQEGSKRRA
jgi:membrane-bound ClpP family serine protease